jgi:hypothetical protein
MDWLHEREVLDFSDRLVLEEGKKSLTESESTRRRHAMLEHLDEVPVRHHRFIITAREHGLLLFESGSLIEWIIELGVSIPDLTSTEYHLESLDCARISGTSLRERGDELWMIHEESRS